MRLGLDLLEISSVLRRIHGSSFSIHDSKFGIEALSLSDGEELVDLGNLCLPEKGFVARRFYLIGKLNSSRPVVLDSLRSAVRSMWRLTVPVDVQARGDRFLFIFSTSRDLVRVEKGGPWIYNRYMLLLNDYDGSCQILLWSRLTS